MSFLGFRGKSVAGNARALNVFSFWFCLRFYVVTAVIYFAQVTGSYFLAVSLMVICRVAQGVFEVPTGIVSDRLGRVWCLRLGALASMASVGCYIVGGNFWWLAVGSVFDGLWLALFSGNNEALLYESSKEAGDGEAFGRHLGAMNVAMEVAGFLAMVSGGFLAVHGFKVAMWLTIGAQTMAFAASFWLVEPQKHVVQTPNVWLHFKEAFGYMRRNATLRDLSLAKVMGDGFSTFALWPAFYSQLMPLWGAGLMVSANYLLSAVGFAVSGRVMKRFRASSIVLFNELYGRTMMLVALIFPSLASPVLMALGGAPYGPATVAIGTLMHAEFTDHQRATMASINSLAGNVLYTGFALATGLVADRWGVGRAILVGQIVMLPVIWLYWRVWRAQRS